MRWFAILSFVCFTALSAAAQVAPTVGVVTGVSVPVSPIAPIPYGYSNSVIDHKGNLLMFDVTYEYPPVLTAQPVAFKFLPTINTRVTIVDSDGSTKSDAQYTGSFQVLGVGRYAVYAIITDYTVSSTSSQVPTTMAPTTITRRLVALSSLFPTLPSVDLAAQLQVKVSAVGDGSAPDMIAIIDSPSPFPVMLAPAGTVAPLPPTPIRQRTVQMFQSDGTSFKPLTPMPIPVP